MKAYHWLGVVGAPVAVMAAVSLMASSGLAQDAARPAVVVSPPAPPASAAAPMPSVPKNAVIPDEVAPAPKLKPLAAAPKPDEADDIPDDKPKPVVEPMKRPRFNAAILQGVDKITAQSLRFEAKVGEPVRYKDLILTVHACETNAADETTPDSLASMDVVSQPEMHGTRTAPPTRQVYRGWMSAGSPGLHPFEHPVYDLWLIACRTSSPGT